MKEMNKNKKEENKLKKNEIYEVSVEDTGIDGEGICHINGITVFVPNALKGEKLKVKIVKVLKNYAFGIIDEIIQKSSKRVENDCKYKSCGGCSLRHTSYENTLEIKENKVKNLLKKELDNVDVNLVYGMDNPQNYRNKLILPVCEKDNKLELGIYAKRSHNIIPINECKILNKQSLDIAKDILKISTKNKISAYNEETKKGIFRNIVVRNTKLNEYMVILVFNLNKNELDKYEQYLEQLKQYAKESKVIQSVVIDFNTKNTNVVLQPSYATIYGKEYIEDKIGNYTFRITPLSFFQINPIQVETLYELVKQKANVNKDDVVFDLYCGTGTIGIYLAKDAKKVYGSEIIPEAIDVAKQNAKLNEITNIEFDVGDSTKVLEKLLSKNIIPDVVILDPPRKGIENETIKNLIKFKIPKIVYVSCNPSTLVRDLKLFSSSYDIGDIDLVDMFPYTNHVECVCVLNLRKAL